MWDKQIKHSLDQQDLCQHAERGRSQLKGAGRRRVGEGGHHAVNNIRHQAQQNQRGDQHQPRLPPEAHRPPGRTSLEQVLDRRKEERKVSWPHRKNHFTGLSAALTLWLKSCREVDPSLWWRPTQLVRSCGCLSWEAVVFESLFFCVIVYFVRLLPRPGLSCNPDFDLQETFSILWHHQLKKPPQRHFCRVICPLKWLLLRAVT